mmetsp:Transcript_72495/g.235482  ORF Transcript_72495/g.235482 Transcript_72495/m.235482 type:complete len:216 (+) Transcript_72495:2435-3082(+)
MQRRPLVAVHHVAVSVMPQQDLTYGASALATLVENGHEHVQRCVAVRIRLVHVGPAVDQQQHHVRVEVHGRHMQGRAKQAAAPVHVNTHTHKCGCDVGVLFADSDQQGRVALAIKRVTLGAVLCQGHGNTDMAFEAGDVQAGAALGIDGVGVEALLRKLCQHLDARDIALALRALLLAEARELVDDALPLRSLDDARQGRGGVAEPLQGELGEVF